MNEVTPKRIDVAQVVIERDGKVLVVHTVGPGDIDRWGLPGGAREPGETLIQAAMREALEETGLEVEVGDLLAVGEVVSDTHDLLFVFRAHAAGEPQVQDGEVVVEHRWLSPEEADAFMPWYPGGVEALLDARVGYYDQPEEPPVADEGSAPAG
ncbi:MAG TPA: NUDIX hydrolase [Gaiellaceae bacterium]|nr:NUDIX hydrolase [Gaiellaceae bacterium]